MKWNHGLSYFWGGAFSANTLPHLISGICGSPFQSPFASPPGEGLSPAMINVAWGLFNAVVGHLLVLRVGQFNARDNRHAALFGLGFAIMAFFGAWHFGAFHNGR